MTLKIKKKRFILIIKNLKFKLTYIYYYYFCLFCFNRWMQDDWLDLATKKLIEDKPNTFTYTKWISESLLEREASDLPVVIVRPSNIGAAWKEPFSVGFHNSNNNKLNETILLKITFFFKGWVEKSSGPCDLFIAVSYFKHRVIKRIVSTILLISKYFIFI